MEIEKEYIASEIESVEHYLNGLFLLPVGVCIADTQDIVRDVLGYDIADLRRAPDPDCVTAFQYVARIEWAPWKDEGWRLMYALYRRQTSDQSGPPRPVEEAERRPLLEMPIAVQRHAHHHLPQLIAAAGGEWPLLRGMMSMTRRALAKRLAQRPEITLPG
jgi:hypothetical protein